MLKLESLHIEELRGIRKLDLSFQGGKSFAISGANGSLGKYRYLLFVIRKGTPDNVNGNTFYSEINIVPVNPQPPVAGQQR